MKRLLIMGMIVIVAATACGGTSTFSDAAATSPAVARPTVEPTPVPTSTPVDLPDTVELVTDQVPVPPGRGLWRVYDQDAQVVCYIYGANNETLAWSGLSCLPISDTHLTP